MIQDQEAVIHIAVASTDGIVVNQHFGKARGFLLYERIGDSGFRSAGRIETEPLCEDFSHKEERLDEIAGKLSGIDAVLVSRIGPEADARLSEAGTPVYIITDYIENALRTWSDYQDQNKTKGERV